MTGPRVPRERRWEELSALVDGELDPPRLAVAAERIAADPAEARDFAALAALKAATAGSLPRPVRPGRRAATRPRVVGGLAVALLLGAAAAATLGLRGVVRPAAPATAAATLEAGLPALDAYGLRLDRVLVLAGPQARAEAVYLGERGCRVRLAVSSASDDSGPSADGVTGWEVAGLAFRLSSEGMDGQRFAALATAAEAATRGAPVPQPVQVAATSTAVPCLG